MNLRFFVAVMAIPCGLLGNPIAIGELDDCPLSAENVTVHFADNHALVDGTYFFDTSLRRGGLMYMTLPVIVRSTEGLKGLAEVFKIKASGNFLGIQGQPGFREPLDYEKNLAPNLPHDLRLVIASWQVGAIMSSERSAITITYRQPLYRGVFYYLPLTRARMVDAENPASAPNFGLQAKLIAEPGRDINLEGPVADAVWGESTLTLNLRHRNLVAATQVRRPNAIDRFAPWVEIISGSRRCGVHHTELASVTAHALKEWDEIMTSDMEVFEDCPNAFSWLTDAQGEYGHRDLVTIRYESCAKCEAGYASRGAKTAANKNRKKPTIEEAFAASSIVFYGRVIATHIVKEENNGSPREMWVGTFEVIQAYKGKPGKQVEIETPMRRIDGNYHFGTGSYHLIYGSGSEPYYMDDFGRSMPGWAASVPVGGKEEFKELETLAAKHGATVQEPAAVR